MSSKSYGDWLKEQRALRRMSQTDVESRADLGSKHVSKFENGRLTMPSEDVRLRIHAALGTSEEDLVEAGLLRRMEYQGRTWYVPIRDEGRASQDAPPIPGAVSLAEVSAAFTDAARGGAWTQPMVQAIVQQIKMYVELQQGAADIRTTGENADASTSEDGANGIAAG